MEKKQIFGAADFIVPKRFADLRPVDYLCREQECRPVELPDELKNLHMIYRYRFSVKTQMPVTLRITADDYYKLYINGLFVGQGPAQGYHYSYNWNEYDITPYLQDGENEIVAQVYYQGLINHAYQSGDRRMGLLAAAFQEGSFLFGTEEGWDCALWDGYTMTHTMGYDTIIAENVDLRKQLQFEKCAKAQGEYSFCHTPATPLSVYSQEPARISQIPGGYLYDFGGEITGVLSLRILGKAGQRVRILCGEELCDSPEQVRYDMRCNSRCEEFIILAEGENAYCQYEYRGFRYAAVLPDKGAEILEVHAQVQHYPFDDTYCQLETDSDVLKAVWDMCKRSVKYGCQETYIDCPTREKGQYVGDMLITSRAQVILTGDTSLLKKALGDVMQSSKISQGLMAVTPSGLMQEIADYSLQVPLLALWHYERTGDRQFLKENLTVCENMLAHFAQFARPDGLLEDVTDQWNLVDWPENLRDGYDFPLAQPMEKGSGCHNVLNAFYVGCVATVEKICEILGVGHGHRAEALRQAFNKEFFNEKTGLYTDSAHTEHSSLHSNVIPLFYGLCEPEQKQRLADFIVEKKLCCGVYMAYFLLKALCRAGRTRDALALILSTEENSWYNMIRQGATTCFEAWGKEQKWNTSLCHPWASAPISLLAEDILPVSPEVGSIVYRNDA